MGWLNSMGVMQEISENLLLYQGLDSLHQISRGHSLPPWTKSILDEAVCNNRSWWHIYLDNYAGGEKRVTGERQATEVGAEVDGQRKTLGVSTEKLAKVIQATLWMLCQKFLNRKHVQILAGRWIFILQFRRPAMGYLQKTWKFISGCSPLTFDPADEKGSQKGTVSSLLPRCSTAI